MNMEKSVKKLVDGHEKYIGSDVKTQKIPGPTGTTLNKSNLKEKRRRKVQVICGTSNMAHHKVGTCRRKRGNRVGCAYESSWARTLKFIGTFDWISKK